MMNYEEAIHYIQRAGKSGISMGLSRMRNLCGKLGNPEKRLRCIHVAGTNGKGSVAAYISSILGVNGLLAGRFVSPVVFGYEECIQFEDSRGISWIRREMLAEAVTEVAEAVRQMEDEGLESPTAFEIETAVAFVAFVKRECQIAIIETGLGGREDATNVLGHVLASVITPISRDHMEYLGNTIEEIAGEKAGIIREQVPVIAYPKSPDAERVIREVCREKNAPLTIVKQEDMRLIRADLQGILFTYQGENFQSRMAGHFQMENAALAIETCRQLGEEYGLDTVRLMLGVREAYWRGRFELVNTDPLILVDGAHNESGAKELRRSLETFFPKGNIHGVMGVFRDKEYESMVAALLPVMQDIVTVTPPSGRGLPAEELKKVWQDQGMAAAETAGSVREGLKKAMERCREGEAIVIFGSLSLLGQLQWK